jgi:hypothetical protein
MAPSLCATAIWMMHVIGVHAAIVSEKENRAHCKTAELQLFAHPFNLVLDADVVRLDVGCVDQLAPLFGSSVIPA